MTANVAKKLEEILERLKKLDVIESSIKSIETKLNCLEERTAVLENFRQTTEKDINDLKENGNFTSSQLSEISTELKNHQVAITDLTQKAEASKELLKELTAKNLYLESYSRRENIRFMNIEDGSSDEPEDVEETLRDFLERELGFHDARSVHGNPKSSSKWKKQEWKARANTGPFSEIRGCPENILTRAPIKRNGLPNVPRLSCRNCQKTQRADEDLQRGKKKQHSCILQSIETR